jgi:hypothetical protein
MNHTGQCQSDSIIFSYIIWPPADSLYWNFRDPASGGANVSNLNNPRHKFTVQGSYLVTLIARHKDRRFDTIFQTINIYESPAPSLGPDPTICQGDSITFDAGVCAGCTYLWTDFLADTVVSTSQTFTTGFQGIYTVKVINADGCKGYDTVQLFTIAPPIVTTNPLSKSICSGDSTQIALTANVSGTTFTWNTIGSSPLVSGFSSGTGDTINQRLVSTSTGSRKLRWGFCGICCNSLSGESGEHNDCSIGKSRLCWYFSLIYSHIGQWGYNAVLPMDCQRDQCWSEQSGIYVYTG